MNMERPKSGQILHCKHSFFKVPVSPTECAQVSTEHQDWNRSTKLLNQFPSDSSCSAFEHHLCNIRCKSGQPECFQKLLQCWRHHYPGIKHLVQVFMSYLSDWTRHRHHSESNLNFVLFRKATLNTLEQSFGMFYLKKHEQPWCPSGNPVMGQGGLAMQPRLSCCVPWHAQFSHCHLSRTTVLLAAELSSFLHSCSKKRLKH